jgi:hypothetical protein
MQDVKSLIDEGDFGSFGRYEEVPLAKMTDEILRHLLAMTKKLVSQ